MTKRLVDCYQINELVQIQLTTLHGAAWQPGRVVGAEHPGLWVLAMDVFWFVTNGRRIRPVPVDEKEEE